jgi:hypothetical protein
LAYPCAIGRTACLSFGIYEFSNQQAKTYKGSMNNMRLVANKFYDILLIICKNDIELMLAEVVDMAKKEMLP